MKEVTIEGDVFNVRRLTIGEMMPLWPLLQSELQADSLEAQTEMLKIAVHKDGLQMGAAVLNLDVTYFIPLLTAVLELNSLGNDEGN